MEISTNLRCYLAGPVEFSDDIGKGSYFERNELEPFLREIGIFPINPRKLSFNGVGEISNRKKIFADKNFEEVRRQMKIIVRKDLRAVDISDFVIAYFPKDAKTTGTIHEIVEADHQQKPVLIICPEGIENIPIWFYGILPYRYFFDSLNDLKEYLYKIVSDKEFRDKDDRWRFERS